MTQTSAEAERRRVFRVELKHPIEADMRIFSINGETKESKPFPVPIVDVGPGGLCCLSALDLPADENIIYRFQTEVLGKARIFLGVIARKRPVRPGNNEYGVRFIGSDKEMMEISRLVNQLAIKARNSPNERMGRRCAERLLDMAHKRRIIQLGK